MSKIKTDIFIPIVVSFVSLFCVFSFYIQLLSYQQNEIKQDCEQTMAVAKNSLQENFLGRKLALKRMANRSDFDKVDISQWKKDAWNYIQDQPGLKTILWTDNRFRVLKDVSVEKNIVYAKQVLERNKKLLKRQQIVIDVSRKKNDVLAFCVIIPNNKGYICAIINAVEFIQACLRLRDHYAIRIWSGKKLIYAANKADDNNTYRTAFTLDNTPLEMELSLTAKTIHKHQSFLSLLFLIIGTLASILFGYLVYVLRKFKNNNVTLQNQTNLFQSLLENMAEGVIVGDRRGNFVLVNSSATRMTGVRQNKNTDMEEWSQEYGCFLPNKIDPFPNDRLPLLRALQGENVDHVEMYIKSPAMEKGCFLNVSGRCIRDANNEITHGVVVFSDITHLRNLKQSNEALDDFAYIVAHDLKEPLRGISSHSRFLLEDYEDVLDDDGKKRLGRLMTLTNNLQKIIEELLYFSRLGREKLAIQKNDLRKIAESAKETFELSNGEVIDIAENLPVVPCNSVQMNKVFFNLINNGLKYNTSAPKKIEIGVDNKEDQYIFYVRDNGIGIESEFHDVVFQIFKRLNSEKEFGGGSGAGLAFVKKIIEKHNGKIWIESQKNVGTTVFFTLNAKES